MNAVARKMSIDEGFVTQMFVGDVHAPKDLVDAPLLSLVGRAGVRKLASGEFHLAAFGPSRARDRATRESDQTMWITRCGWPFANSPHNLAPVSGTEARRCRRCWRPAKRVNTSGPVSSSSSDTSSSESSSAKSA